MEYTEFLEKKRKVHILSGFDAQLNSPQLFPFQNYVVNTALKAGKYAVFSGTGTGKTRMQLTWAQEVSRHTGGKVLILAPLAVSGQTIEEGNKIGINPECYDIINYEQLHNVDTSQYSGVAIDEASILKSYDGAYRKLITETFKLTPYKSVWSATPAPNDPMEIGNYSEFLDVMPGNEMLAMYFVHDGGETSKWRVKGHAEKRLWEWVSSWATMFGSPKDIGFDQEGYDLPPLNIIERQVKTPVKEGKLFNNTSVSATDYNAELRITKKDRIAQVVQIVKNNPHDKFIIWVKHNDEGDMLRKEIPDAIEVSGSDSQEWKETHLLGFARGEFRILITKSKIAGMGLNYQICHNQIFASPDFSFEAVYQSIRRSWRFGQTNEVNAYIITTDTMENVLQTFKRKSILHEKMQQSMTDAINKHITHKKNTRMFEEIKTDNFHFMHGDCVELIKSIPDESIGFSMWSPPFPSVYVYSDQLEDMGNSVNMDEFVAGFEFLVKDLFRVMKSGRNVAVHCMDLPIQKGKEGFIGLRDFSGVLLKSFLDAGFIYHSRVTIWKDPVTEMQRTKALGLLHKQIKKDASMSRVGIPDYLLVFRKPGEHLDPVVHQDKDPQQSNYLPVSLWQKIASPVWMDVDQTHTLNYRSAREDEDEKHICPLQIDTIERATHLWSNEGDTCLSVFGGIASEASTWIKMKRKAISMELKKSYYDVAVKNCKEAESVLNTLKLF